MKLFIILNSIFIILGASRSIAEIVVPQNPQQEIELTDSEKNLPTVEIGDHFQRLNPQGTQQLPMRPTDPLHPANFLGLARPDIQTWVTRGLQKVSELLLLADRKVAAMNSSWKIPQSLYTKAQVVEVHWPKAGYNFTNCDPGTLAFTYPNGNDIYLCSRIVSDEITRAFLAQVLVHELAHDIGYRDECDASKIEIAIMRYSGLGLQFKNRYLDRCGIR